MHPNATMSLAQRFEMKVDRSAGPDGCHHWTANKVTGGYGRIGVAGRHLLAHRVAWELANGPIPPGLLVCHRCDTPGCVNVRHLFLGDADVNTADRVAKGRNGRAPGEANPGARLTAAEVIAIRRGRDSGATYIALARCYGVGMSTIARIVKRLNWRHLP